jgi:hypothetical protein
MKKFSLKTVTWYGIIGLLIAVAFLPILKSMAPEYFPEGWRDIDCQGVTCPEGQFCASGKKCVNITNLYPNAVPTGNE